MTADTAAEKGDHAPLLALQRLFEAPYEEQPGADARYYRRQPADLDGQAGVSFMS